MAGGYVVYLPAGLSPIVQFKYGFVKKKAPDYIFLLTYIVLNAILVLWDKVYLAHPDKNHHIMLDIWGFEATN